MNVLSLFDGISCGQVALQRAGIQYSKYYASEIDKYAIQVTQKNHPNTIQMGDINNWREWDIDWSEIGILLAGFPCQAWSLAGKQRGDNDPRGELVHVLIDLFKHIKQINPNLIFLFENVKMKREFLDYIDRLFGCKHIMIDSALVSAQNRKRVYWTNIKGIELPQDKGILLKHIIHENTNQDMAPLSEKEIQYMKRGNEKWQQAGKCRLDRYLQYKENKSFTVTANIYKGVPYNCFFQDLAEYIVPFDKTLKILDKEVQEGKVGYFRKDSQANRVYYIHNKAVTLCGDSGGGAAKMGQYLFGCITPDRVDKRQNWPRFNHGTKFYTLTAQDKHGILIEGYIRKLTPIECERLQTLPDDYTKGISKTQRYKCLGNGWTVDVISHILNCINNKPKETQIDLTNF